MLPLFFIQIDGQKGDYSSYSRKKKHRKPTGNESATSCNEAAPPGRQTSCTRENKHQPGRNTPISPPESRNRGQLLQLL